MGAAPDGGASSRSDADHHPQLVQGVLRRPPDQSGGLLHLVRRQPALHLQPSGVQGDQGHPVGHHVVHLARDPRPLGAADLLRAQPLLRLRAHGSLLQRPDQAALGTGQRAPGDRRGADGDVDGHGQGQGAVPGVDGIEHQPGGDVQDGEGERDGKRAAARDGVEREHVGRPGRREDGGRDSRAHRDRDRSPVPPPQRGAAHRADSDVEDELRSGRPLLQHAVQQAQPGGERQQAPRRPRPEVPAARPPRPMRIPTCASQ